MRYVVHAHQHRESIDFAFSTAADAVAKAWRMMASGATGLYIFDNVSYETFSPGEFIGLFRTTAVVSQVGKTKAALSYRPDAAGNGYDCGTAMPASR